MPASVLSLKVKSSTVQKKPLVVAVGKTVSKKAVERNFLKRRIRAIMQPVLKKRKNHYLIVVRPGILSLSYADLEREINEQLLNP